LLADQHTHMLLREPITDRSILKLSIALIRWQGRNEEEKGERFPGRQITMGMPNHCRGCPMTAGGAEKSQQFSKYFLQYSKFASERARVRTWGAKFASCPRRHL